MSIESPKFPDKSALFTIAGNSTFWYVFAVLATVLFQRLFANYQQALSDF